MAADVKQPAFSSTSSEEVEKQEVATAQVEYIKLRDPNIEFKQAVIIKARLFVIRARNWLRVALAFMNLAALLFLCAGSIAVTGHSYFAFVAGGGLIYSLIAVGIGFWHVAMIYSPKAKFMEVKPIFPPFSMMILLNNIAWLLFDFIAMIISGIIVGQMTHNRQIRQLNANNMHTMGNPYAMNMMNLNPMFRDPNVDPIHGTYNTGGLRVGFMPSHKAAYSGFLFFISFSAIVFILDTVAEGQRYFVSISAWQAHGLRGVVEDHDEADKAVIPKSGKTTSKDLKDAKDADPGKPIEVSTPKEGMSSPPSPKRRSSLAAGADVSLRQSPSPLKSPKRKRSPETVTESVKLSPKPSRFKRKRKVSKKDEPKDLSLMTEKSTTTQSVDGSIKRPDARYRETEIEVELETHDEHGNKLSQTEAVARALRKFKEREKISGTQARWKIHKEQPPRKSGTHFYQD